MISSRNVDQFSSKTTCPVDSVGVSSFALACYVQVFQQRVTE